MIHVERHPHVRLTSLTRIASLDQVPFSLRTLAHDDWVSGDYVACKVVSPHGAFRQIELPGGRMIFVERGDVLIGALGRRHATLELTGTFEAVEDDGRMHLLSGGGMMGRVTSVAPAIGAMMDLHYRGHLFVDERKATMERFVPETDPIPFSIPTVLLVGTSMSAGKTTAGRLAVRHLRKQGLVVAGAKLAGAGRYRDVLAFGDAGAAPILDFVDAGLPSTVVPEAEYQRALGWLLARLAAAHPDVAVIEVGASPLEPYNGAAAIEALQDRIAFVMLAASDPYAAHGIIEAYGLRPDLICGRATNTHAGVELAERLCGVPALNLSETPEALGPLLDDALRIPRSHSLHNAG
ncbi:MAG: hypothetical protein HKN04_13140 [Rhodothermaceae bacterium]|nr:hypothetical protein [Rhodothermaceae bacterium]